MIKNYGHKKRRKFDMDADWLPQKNRPFVMKGSQPNQPEPPVPPPSDPPVQPSPPTVQKQWVKTSDATGLKTAYAAESVFS